MKDTDKTKEQLISELAKLHKRLAQLKTSETERKQTKQALKKSEKKYHDLLDHANDLIQYVGPDARIIFVNKKWLETLEYSAEELKNLKVTDILHENQIARIMELFKGTATGRTVNNIETTFISKYGKEIYVEGSGSGVIEYGKFIGAIGIFRDITERKQAERELRESEEKFRLIAETSPDYIVQTDNQGKVVYASPSVKSMLGYDPEELEGKDYVDLVPTSTLSKAQLILRKASKGEVVKNLEVELLHKGGKIIPVEVSLAPIIERNEIAGYLAISRDITERKQAEEALRESEEQYRSIVNLSGEVGEAVIMLQDTDQGEGIQTFVNDEWPRITGYSCEELIGMSFFSLVHPKDREVSQERHRSKMKGKVIPGLFEITIIRKDGTEVPVELTSAYTTYKGGHANVAYIRNITERKKAEEKIKASLVEKELLLKEVHHRVKNNMQVISSLLKLRSASIKNKEDAVVFKDSQDRIKSMALVYNKLYQAEDLAHIDFGEYVREMVSGLAHSYKAVSGKVTTSVEGDGVSLGVDLAIPCGLVINELITNSLKYAFPKGRGGEIRVSIGESEGEVEMTVSDDGVGIPASLDLAGSKTLGLRLVGNLVEQLSGKIELDRTAGTKFRITFRKNQE